ncbi:MAG: alpha/beta hydrolase [Peptococcaceae bacterium]|nr:alpha/beta hydrolase [Peptococcaceae bacterium]
MPYVTVGGVKCYYSAKAPDGGEPKQAILFIHGAGGSQSRWSFQVLQLGREYLAMAVDLPGHGLSGGRSSDSIESYREFVRAFSECLLGHPFFLAGHSMGGAVALDFALHYPDRLAGLVLMGTGSRLRVLPAILEAFGSGSIPDNLARRMYRPGTPEELIRAAEEEINKIDPSVFYSDFMACDKFDVSARLGEINVPTLVMTGDKDVMTPVKYGKFLADNIKNAAFEIIEDAGHMLMIEQALAVNTALLNFIKNTVSFPGGLEECPQLKE